MYFFIGSEFSDRVPPNVKPPSTTAISESGESLTTVNRRQTGESPVPLPEMLSGFRRNGPRNAFRRDVRQQSRLFARNNPRLRRSPNSNRLCCAAASWARQRY